MAGIRTLDPIWAWQTRDALDLTSKIFQWVGWAAASPLKFFRRHSVLPLARAQRQRFDRIFPSVGPSVELQPSEGKDVQNFSFFD